MSGSEWRGISRVCEDPPVLQSCPPVPGILAHVRRGSEVLGRVCGGLCALLIFIPPVSSPVSGLRLEQVWCLGRYTESDGVGPGPSFGPRSCHCFLDPHTRVPEDMPGLTHQPQEIRDSRHRVSGAGSAQTRLEFRPPLTHCEWVPPDTGKHQGEPLRAADPQPSQRPVRTQGCCFRPLFQRDFLHSIL